ncbi:unnamed protein product [Rhizopus stolonifer]
MQITYAILVFSLFTAVTSISNEKRILRVPVERRSRPDPIISSRLNKRDSYLTTLYNDLGSQYLINIGIGTPAQNFTVTLDTGSADLWVPGNTCPTTDCPNNLFDSSSSSTYKSLNKQFTLAYGIGNVNGSYVTDTVTLAGLSMENQQFGLASDTQNILTNPSTITVATQAKLTRRAADTTANGILGLGYPRLTASYSKSQSAYNPLVFNLAAQDIISDPVFSIYLNNADMDGWVGELLLGGVDQTKFKGNLTYLPVVSLSSVKSKRASLNTDGKYYWMVGAQGVAVTTAGNNTTNNTSSISLSFNSTSAFILDTGTTLTYLPTSMAENIIESIAGKGNYSIESSSETYLVNCNVAAQSDRQLELIITDDNGRGVSLSVPASQLVIPLDGSTAANSKSCLFGIAPSSGSGNMHLVGDSVLRSAYMVFDMVNNKVGIAAAVGLNGNVQESSLSFSSAGDRLSVSLIFVSLWVLFNLL